MGPEPYSLAIILRENMGRMLFRNVRIHATDIDESGKFGEIIRKGIYTEDRVKRIPGEIREKYFTACAESGSFRISEEIRNCVSYYRHDLLTLEPIRNDFTLIVCKNVLLHFNDTQRADVIRMFHNALENNGFFITEQTQKMPLEIAGRWHQIVENAQLFTRVKQIETSYSITKMDSSH
jgi:chemotaxis protein methyltransferase CheR